MGKPQHIVHESYGDYRERMSSGNFILYIFGGALISFFGLILWSFSYAIFDRLLAILLILGGVYIMVKNVMSPKRPRYRDTAHRISFG
ncbi:MAG: hypothetical protein Q8P79_01840 [Nanoarchaeota archaeon]|nr:hypothetical protein [Nanoarchaeota archaeon]